MRDLEKLKKSSQEKIDSYFSNIKILEYIDTKHARLFCTKCKYDWYGDLHNTIYNHRGCPVCSNQKIVKGINSLWDTHPHIAKHLKNKEDGYNVSYGSGKKLIWLCPNCGFETKPLPVYQVTKHGISCHKCSDNMSLPNKYMFNLLSLLLGNGFDYEVVFDWCKFNIEGKEFSGRYDFVFCLNDKKYIVEMDGSLGHGNRFSYIKIEEGKKYRTPELCLEIDKQKDKLAEENGYHMIRIECFDSSFEYITTNVKNSELSNLFDLDSINYVELFEKCMTSRIFEAIELWESGIKNTREIARIMKTSVQTIIPYLKKGVAINKCSYTVEEAWESSRERHIDSCRKVMGRKVVCLTTGEIFNSHAEAKEKYGIKTFQFRKGKSIANIGIHPITQERLVWQKYDDYIKTA